MTASDTAPIRMGRFSFINVDPVYHGLEQGMDGSGITLSSAPPATLNRLLAEGSLDISSVSSAAYAAHHRDWLLLPGFSVSCSGNVMSVLLASRVPMRDLEGQPVLITDESATAAALTRLLFHHHGVSPRFSVAKVPSPELVPVDAAAALVIGDSSLRYDWDQAFEFVWDLGDLWARHAGLPFVFALWAVRRDFASAHPERVTRAMAHLQESKRIGLEHLSEIVRRGSEKLAMDPVRLRKYFENFCFDLNPPQLAGLRTFYRDLHAARLIPEEVKIRFFGDA